MIKTVFFDMNETLLNLNLLNEKFSKYFDDTYVLKYWFTKLLHSSTVLGIMDEYKGFSELAELTLENLFYENKMLLSDKIKNDILGSFKSLPAYSDVVPALEFLKEKNIRVIAVSNSSLQMMEEQLINAKIIQLFDAYYSVDQVKKYKPFESIYTSVLEKEGLHASETLMIATHDWDLFGAKKTAITTAFIKRKEEPYNIFYPKPDFEGSELKSLLIDAI